MIGVVLFGLPHLTVLAVTAALAFLLCVARRRVEGAGAKLRGVEYLLAVVLCLTFPAQVVLAIYDGRTHIGNYLPLHVCDLAAFLGAYALVTRGRLASELVYFWGMGATLHALVTPAGLHFEFPHPGFFVFFINHGCIVITAMYVVAGRRDYPRRGAAWRAFLCSQAYLAVAGLANILLGTNFAFLCWKPTGTGSLLDVMGPWPWYLIWLEVAIFVVIWILYVPFYVRNRIKGRRPVSVSEDWR